MQEYSDLDNKEIGEYIKNIKRDFFSFRNGIVVETLKTIYPKDKLIYGLTVSEFLQLSNKYPKNKKLGLELWADRRVRESRIMALYILPHDSIEYEEASALVREVESIEEAEMLSFKLLRNLPYATEILEGMSSENNLTEYSRHCLEMLRKNLERDLPH